MKWLGILSGKLYSEEESENMPECGIRVNDSEAEDPEILKELHANAKESLDCGSCRACPAYTQKLLEEAANEWGKAMTEMRKLYLMCCGSYEIEYQQKHKKVKDRYSSTKFYVNSFKRNKRRKK